MIHTVHNLFSIYRVEGGLDELAGGLVPLVHELLQLHLLVVPLHHAEDVLDGVQFRLVGRVVDDLELQFLELRLHPLGFVHDEVVHEQHDSSERISQTQSNQCLTELFRVHAPLELHR